jgi:hypothetical protein
MVEFRKPSDLGYKWFGKGRKAMLAACKDEGISDVCTCDMERPQNIPSRIRPNSGRVGMRECLECKHLIWPLSYVFDCDECTEPVLSDTFPPPDNFICFDCALDTKN